MFLRILWLCFRVYQLNLLAAFTLPNITGALDKSATLESLKSVEELRAKYRHRYDRNYESEMFSLVRSAQSSTSPGTYPRRSGEKGVSAMINDEHLIIMCSVPKVGSSTWRRFMLFLQFPFLITREGVKNYRATYGHALRKSDREIDPHAIAKNGVKVIAALPEIIAQNYYLNTSYLKVNALLFIL